MKRLINWFKNVRPLKVLSVFLAGMFLILTQACNRPTIAGQPPQPGAESGYAQPGAESRYTQRQDPTKAYNLNAPEGGMNNFSDVDPRAKSFEKSAINRAEDLSRNAERNINQKGIDSTEQYARNYRQGTPLGERVKNLGEDIGSSAQGTAEGVAKGTQRGIENIKENTGNAAQNLSKNVQRAGEDAGKNIQRQAEDAGDAVNRTFRNID
jgi:flagellar biosynthesis/type III secretory pathway protein FliH